jgi:DNA repair exonuclease SbcCD nuclease subunit
VHGNHDPLDGWSAIHSWPNGVTVFGSTTVESVPVVRDGTTLATMHGISYAKRDTTENLSLGFGRTPGVGLQIGLLHCNVGDNGDHASYSPCSIDDLVRVGLDYWALGHVHQSQLLSTADPLIAYPGCLQGRSTHPAERGPKGALVVEADSVGVQAIHFEPLDQVRFLDFDMDVSSIDDVPGLQRALLRQATDIRAKNDGRGLVLRAHLTGRGEVHRDLLRPDVVPALLQEVRREAEGNHPFLWWSDIHDRSRLIHDFDAVRARGDFSSELLRISELLKSDTEQRDLWLFDQLEALRRGSLQRWLEGSTVVDGSELIERAESLALDILEDSQDR